jgi:mannose-1-phosphate guanylyltransferase
MTMRESGLVLSEPRGSMMHTGEGNLWAIILAGGEDHRLTALTRRLYGVDHARLYGTLWGPASLLRQTLDRVGTIVPPERTVISTLESHEHQLNARLAGHGDLHVLAQPSDRGTGAAVLLPAHWIAARDPRATVAVFSIDHLVLDEAAFLGRVIDVVGYVQAHPEWLVLLGAEPTEPDGDYGWIEPGDRLDATGEGAVYRVRAFVESPTADVARRLFGRHCLWNTFVFAGSASSLIDAGRDCIPMLHDRLVRLGLYLGTRHEGWGLRQAYQFAPTSDFSRAILESCPPWLAVTPLPRFTWCDLGTPRRVARAVERLQTSWPPSLTGSE